MYCHNDKVAIDSFHKIKFYQTILISLVLEEVITSFIASHNNYNICSYNYLQVLYKMGFKVQKYMVHKSNMEHFKCMNQSIVAMYVATCMYKSNEFGNVNQIF